MKQVNLKIAENGALTNDIYKMILKGDTSEITHPGQFVNIALEGRYLRRPISVCDLDSTGLTIVYKVVGGGTDQMSRMPTGQSLDVLTGLGNGFNLSYAGTKPILIGGGVGIPPLYLLAKDLIRQGAFVTAVLGFNTASEVFYEKEFASLGVRVIVATADGSYGNRGMVTEVPIPPYSYIYACGPIPMLKAVHRIAKTEGQYSFESRMGCGFGACMGCSMNTKGGFKRICKDGPVFNSEEIIWED